MHVVDGDPARLEVELEDGTWRRLDQVDHWVEPRDVDGTRVGEATFAVPTDLPLGYHRLHASSDDAKVSGTLIVTPAWLGLPEPAAEGRSWGFAAQLYSVRSRRLVGRRRPRRPRRARDVVGRARCRLRPGQPAARRRAAAAARAVAVPARRADASSTRSTCASRTSRSTPSCRSPVARRVDQIRRAGAAVGSTADSAIERDPAWAAKLAALLMVHDVERSPERGPRVRGVPGPRG